MNNPLDAVMTWYRTAYDSLRVTRRVVERGEKGLVTEKHVFFGLPVAESGEKVTASIVELGNVVVLALVAVFERTLRAHIVDLVQNTFPGADAFRERVRKEIEKDVEFWHFSERLVDVFEVIPAPDRGNVKQLIDFRNWVAHGHFLALPAPCSADPQSAYLRLTEFLKAAQIVA